MLIISRKRSESLVIGDNIIVTVIQILDDKVRLGIELPKEIPVHRREVFEAIRGAASSQLRKEPTPQFGHAIIFVSDMARSIAFYRDVLGLPVRFESAKWTEFETPGCTLALHLADSPRQATSSADAIPAGVCHLSFAVEDLNTFHQEMVAKGIPCLQPPEEEDFGGRLPDMPIPMGCRSGSARR